MNRYGVDVGVKLRTDTMDEWNRINSVLDQFDTEDHPSTGAGTGLGYRDMQFEVKGSRTDAVRLADRITGILVAAGYEIADGESYVSVYDNAYSDYHMILEGLLSASPWYPDNDEVRNIVWGYVLSSYDQADAVGTYEDLIDCVEAFGLKEEFRVAAEQEERPQ